MKKKKKWIRYLAVIIGLIGICIYFWVIFDKHGELTFIPLSMTLLVWYLNKIYDDANKVDE